MTYEALLQQNLAAERDARTRARDDRWWDLINDSVTEARLADDYTESGTWVRIQLVVCTACDGRGRYVNPSIDAHGLTREDFDEDPDFAESYFRGDYDVPCELCHGEKVIPVPLDKEVAARIDQHIAERYEAWYESYAERMVGA